MKFSSRVIKSNDQKKIGNYSWFASPALNPLPLIFDFFKLKVGGFFLLISDPFRRIRYGVRKAPYKVRGLSRG